MTIAQDILLSRRLILFDKESSPIDEKRRAYINAYLLVNYGIEISNPGKVTDEALLLMDELLHLQVPMGFYANPQDTVFFNSDELLLEQVVSYYIGYGTPIKRVPLFRKALPKAYIIGDEVMPRTYRIIDKEEGDGILREYARELADYKRPFAFMERQRYCTLVDEGYIDIHTVLGCRDNVFSLLINYPELARQLDKKDLVKYSILHFGAYPKFAYDSLSKDDVREMEIIAKAMPLVKDCPLSKRQAKFYNKLIKTIEGHKGKENNSESPYKKFVNLMKAGHVVEAAEYIATQGSLFERNLKYILSRCRGKEEIDKVISLLPNKNPAVLIQLYSTIISDAEGKPRTFAYSAYGRLHTHTETKVELRSRRSALDERTKDLVRMALGKRIYSYYEELPKLGKIYVNPAFKKVAVPINTSYNGKGLDILPSGSRIPFDNRFLRVFCHWEEAFDIDLSLALLKEEHLSSKQGNDFEFLSWRDYNEFPFGKDALCSGDDTSSNGAEFQDINVDGLARRGFLYAISVLNGYGSKLDQGRIIQGLQFKDKLDTTAWDPKNIAFQMTVKGDSRAYVGFAVDLRSKEIIVINALSTGAQILGESEVNLCKRFFLPEFLDINMYDLLSHRGELVKEKEEADIVFDSDYTSETQKVIHPYDVETLVSLANGKM